MKNIYCVERTEVVWVAAESDEEAVQLARCLSYFDWDGDPDYTSHLDTDRPGDDYILADEDGNFETVMQLRIDGVIP